MPHQPVPSGYEEGDDPPEWPLAPDNTPLSLSQTDDGTTITNAPVTHHFQQMPDVVPQPRWGTIQIDARLRLRFVIGGMPQPVSVEVFDTLLLGRSCLMNEQPSLDLNPYGGYWYGVSRQHALILVDDGMLKLVDLDSTNGTFLNGTRLPPHQPRILRDGDEIMLSRLVMQVFFG